MLKSFVVHSNPSLIAHSRDFKGAAHWEVVRSRLDHLMLPDTHLERPPAGTYGIDSSKAQRLGKSPSSTPPLVEEQGVAGGMLSAHSDVSSESDVSGLQDESD